MRKTTKTTTKKTTAKNTPDVKPVLRQLRKFSNSHVVTVPLGMLTALDWHVGDVLAVTVDGGALHVKKVNQEKLFE